MNQLRIQLDRESLFYKPGELLRGTAHWHLDVPQRRVEVRLCWFTGGHVIPESRVVDTIRFQAPAAGDKRPFSFRLPLAPYSFFGSRSLLGWAVELVTLPANQSVRAVF